MSALLCPNCGHPVGNQPTTGPLLSAAIVCGGLALAVIIAWACIAAGFGGVP